MNRQSRLAESQRVKVIDIKSPHFGKTAILETIKTIPVQMINGNSKVVSSREENHFFFRFEEEGIIVELTRDQIEKL